MAFSLRPVRLGALLLALLLASIVFAAPTFADHPEADGDAGLSAVVLRSIFTEPDAHLAHNIPNLRVTVGGEDIACNFLSHYESTGGVTRWGFATSEVVEERPGGLSQYYQRGVVDCQQRDRLWRMERRLVWDYLGGGLGDAPDLGVEPDLLSEQPGRPLGPWGHRVSNLAIDGTPTGFLDFYVELGGLQAFGLPKTDARLDDAPGAMLGIEDAAPGVIRQYFQAAVFEHRPGRSQPVQLRLLGDVVRDVLYPFETHQAFQSFRSAEPLSDDQTFVPEGTSARGTLVARYHASRDALVVLYHATDGPNWNNNTNWLSDAPLGEWYGVTTEAGRVTELILSQNQLSGEVPPELGRLTDLEWLSLWGNQLEGEIPPEIRNLDNVHTLSLWANQFRGSIPAELGDMASLEWVALGINQLTGPIPPELGNLTTLTHMDFTLNQLSGEIPAELGNLTNLVWLGFWANQLSGELPPELGSLTNLTRLDLDHNRLSGAIPAELGNLVNLRMLYLRENHLSGAIPPELGNLTNLRTLLLAGNELTGCVPAELEAVPQSDVDDLGLPLCESEESDDSGGIRRTQRRLRPSSGGGGFQTRPTTGLVRVGAPLQGGASGGSRTSSTRGPRGPARGWCLRTPPLVRARCRGQRGAC